MYCIGHGGKVRIPELILRHVAVIMHKHESLNQQLLYTDIEAQVVALDDNKHY